VSRNRCGFSRLFRDTILALVEGEALPYKELVAARSA
jgi:hypothetical protein